MRSLLFVPGDDPRKLAKGLASEADVVIVDLEDSVAAARKDIARRETAAFLSTVSEARARSTRTPAIHVRVNAFDTGFCEADLAAVMAMAPDGIMLPKSGGGPDVMRLDAMLCVHEAEAGIADGATRIVVVATETAASLFTLGTYRGSSARLAGMAWGAEDLSADLGAATNRDGAGFTEPYRFARNLCLFGAVAARVIPIDTVFTNFRDMDGLRSQCEEAVRDGFTAKMAIHPGQVAVINEVFTPQPAAIERAARIVAAFGATGDMGVIALDGEMLDRPHLTRAEKLLERARLAGVYP